ncbi:MAG: hypothetical protein AAFU64_18130, partial [Bacteroidota bacterium]
TGFILVFLLLLGFGYLISRKNLLAFQKWLLINGFTSLLINVYLSLYIFSMISDYRAEIQAAHYLNAHHKDSRIMIVGKASYRFDFYSALPFTKHNYITRKEYKAIDKAPLVLSTDIDDDFYQDILKEYELIQSYDHYDNDNIKPTFLNPLTRKQSLIQYRLLRKR